MELRVEVSDKLPFFDELKKLEVLRDKIQIHLNNVLGINSKVTLVEPKTIQRSTGNKLERVIDLRNK
jgi:phenylacetate-CoA ligase